jgi:GGDEF domain-containing protein
MAQLILEIHGVAHSKVPLRLSLSIGMARFDPKHPVSPGTLIATAEEAMYEEKRKRPTFSGTW